MEAFARKFFSMKMMAVGMFIFLVAIAVATFMESAYDTQTAKLYIYNATWFSILLAFLGFNLISNIFTYQLFRQEKIHSFLFHVGFLVMLLGAAVTRFISFEGTMNIREGESSNTIYSSDPYLWIKINDGKQQLTFDELVYMSELDAWNGFGTFGSGWDLEFPNHKNSIQVEYVDFRKNIVDSLVTNDSIRESSIELVLNGKSQYVAEGAFGTYQGLAFSYDKENAMPGVEIERKANKLLMKITGEAVALPMSVLQASDRENPDIADSLYVQIPQDTLVPMEKAMLYNVNGVQFVYKDLKRNTKYIKMKSPIKDAGRDILTVKVTDGKHTRNVDLPGGWRYRGDHVVFQMNGLQYEMEYGAKEIKVPFQVYCNDFRMETYPGSNSPSSFESDLKIIDAKNNYQEEHELFMNHVVDYGGYRFFQSSYDTDLKGTILSVNHDLWGTLLSYIGYSIMGLGMLMSLFMKNTRFAELNKKLAKLSAVVLIGTTASFAQDRSIVDDTVGHNGHDHSGHDHSAHEHEHDHAQAPAKKKNYKFLYMTEEHSDELASLLVQDFRGRIVPFHTLADQVMRKVYRGNELENEAKTLNAVQTFMSVMMYPGYWEDKELIYVSSKGGLREKLKLKGTHTTPLSLVDNDFNFVLNDDYRKAHQKMESRRGEYDKQVIKLHDHFQLFLEWVNWARFKIVPVQNDSLNTWTTPMLMEADSVDIPSYQLAGAYIQALDQAIVEKDYSQANLVLKKLKTLQRKIGADVVPSETMVAAEISYNKQGIFKRVANYYAYLGFALLIAFFLKIMRSSHSEKSKKIGKWIVRSLVGLLVVTVLYHAYGLVLRAIITQEVPWTNGYEAMVFISLMVMVTGFALSRKHAVILAGASILAYLLMFVNEMSLLDPEITPLVPVLKSYWLKIHVAIITGSYAPLGLASILGLITMILYVVRGKNNGVQMTNNIKALTYINEMLMIVGVFMLTIGTFLGGVWANESWGRYWGWDAKETWALVAVLCYGVILHFRFIPALRGKFLLNAASFWGYSTILFTFFGVNFYLVGLHSYAQGEGFGSFPTWLIVTVVILIAFTVVASIRNRQYKRHQTAIKSIENE